MANKATFFDLPSAHKPDGSWSCFSFNPWKIRAALNYKQIPYETQWCEYPDLDPTLRALEVKAHEEPHPLFGMLTYTSPTLRFPDGVIVMESIKIAERLESLYPEPSLHLDAGFHGPVTETVEGTFAVYGPDAMVDVVTKALPPRSSQYFRETREAAVGMPLEDLQAMMMTEENKQKAEAPDGPMAKLRDILTKNKKDEGPFILGSQPSYGDFIAVGLFEAILRVSAQHYERVIGFDDSFKKLHEACQPYLERDN